MPSPSERLARLFGGQRGVWGAVHGEQVKRPLTAADWDEHVHGEGSVGVYPLCPRIGSDVYQEMYGPFGDVDEWVVHWGCVDIDDGYESSLVTARNLHKAYKILGLTSWIERTKGKGMHVWLFVDGWVSAVQMRAVQILACKLIEYVPKEINPKQIVPPSGVGGSYVNIPYAKKWSDEGRRVVLDPEVIAPYSLDTFLTLAEGHFNTPGEIAKVAALYREPPKPRVVEIGEPDLDLANYPPLSPLTAKVFEEGPLPHPETGHIDRSSGLQRLAHLCAKDGLLPSQAYVLVRDLDRRLGKYVGRRDAEEQYRKIVERAYET